MTKEGGGLVLGRRDLIASGFALAGLAKAGLARASDPQDAGAALRALISESVKADAALDPLQAARADTAAAGQFVDPLSDSYRTARLASKRQAMARLLDIPRDRLSPVDRLAWDVFHRQTEFELETFSSGLFDLQLLIPLDPSFGLQVTFPDAASGEGARFETQQDYENGLARLSGFAGYLESAVDRLKEGRAKGYLQPRIVVQNILAEVAAMVATPVEDTPFYKPIRSAPPTLSVEERDRFARAYHAVIEDRILPGYRLWQSYLTQTYLPVAREAPGLCAMKDGDRLYAHLLRLHTTTDLDADRIHALGLSEVQRIRAAMEEVRQKLGFKGDLHALFAHVRSDPSFYFTRPEDLLERFKSIEARIWAGMPRLFARKPKAPFEVRPLPAVGEARGTGYYNLGPPDGSGPGVLYFNMAMLPTRPIPTLETLTLHEGIPGHHFQGSLAQENTALPDILRFDAGFTAYVEGWGLYSESLGRELGLFTDPWQWFGHLDFEMLRAARLVVDTGLHAKSWSRDRAIAYLTDNTSMAAKDIGVEIDRYIAAPGQATAYKVGELKIRELRGKAESALGAKFDIRNFHDQVLMTGPLPLDLLASKIEGWIEAGGPAYE
jgi:uncharacterized protein (DUF885 family)